MVLLPDFLNLSDAREKCDNCQKQKACDQGRGYCKRKFTGLSYSLIQRAVRNIFFSLSAGFLSLKSEDILQS